MPRPTDTNELCDAIADAARAGQKLAIRGGGSKQDMGAATPDATILDMTGFCGVIDYDPPELVLTVSAATPLAEITALLASREQMLAFEPFDHGPIFGRPSGNATIGGIIAAGVAGSQRLAHGAARDHLLGFQAVSGRAEAFVAGGKVVKNVTGYDLPKLMTASWGRLAALTQLTLKVLPRPRAQTTLILENLPPRQAQAAMARAMGSPTEVSAAGYIPANLADGTAITAIRIQGFGPSVAARATLLGDILAEFGPVRPADDALWSNLRTLALLDPARPLWRINVPPSGGCLVIEALGATDFLFDWAGGLVWLASDADPALIRQVAIASGGHAALVRATAAVRALVPMQHPQAPGVAKLEARIRRGFDPSGVFETGRFLDHANAD